MAILSSPNSYSSFFNLQSTKICSNISSHSPSHWQNTNRVLFHVNRCTFELWTPELSNSLKSEGKSPNNKPLLYMIIPMLRWCSGDLCFSSLYNLVIRVEQFYVTDLTRKDKGLFLQNSEWRNTGTSAQLCTGVTKMLLWTQRHKIRKEEISHN